ncbi:MAG TPA: hypothetical protein VEC37_05695, partial [Bacillota bacterium]|nr:hypothetical protein [Bacillota bacterium]
MNTSQTNEKSLLNNIQSHLLKLPVKPVQKQELIALFTQITHYCCEANHWAMLEELLALMDKLQYILKRKPDHITVPLDEQLQNLRALLLFKIRNMTDSRQQLTIPVIPDSPNRQPEEKTIKRNLILNGDFEEDSQAPTHWEATNAGILSRSGKN